VSASGHQYRWKQQDPFPFKKTELDLRGILRYTKILKFSFERFHCCSLEPNSSALLLGKSRSLIILFNSLCVIRCSSLNSRSAVKSASVDFGGRDVFSRFSVGSRSESKIYSCIGTGTGRSSVWGTDRIAEGINRSTNKMYP